MDFRFQYINNRFVQEIINQYITSPLLYNVDNNYYLLQTIYTRQDKKVSILDQYSLLVIDIIENNETKTRFDFRCVNFFTARKGSLHIIKSKDGNIHCLDGPAQKFYNIDNEKKELCDEKYYIDGIEYSKVEWFIERAKLIAKE